jgi:flagellar hook-associated protein 1 FlgK
MSLSSALNIAMSGLTANQAALSIVSSNVANAGTAGYVSLTPTQVSVGDGSSGVGVEVTGINRQLNQYLQSQLRTETAGNTYAGQMSNVLQQLQSVYGTPGGASTLETAYNSFTSAVQALSTSSGSTAAQNAALTAAQGLAQQLNSTTQGIQQLRTNTAQDLGTSVTTANSLMSQIAQINGQLQGMNATDTASATLMDQRDTDITQLSQLMDVNVINGSNNQATVYTNSGVQLVDGSQASTMTYNAPGTLNATVTSLGSLTLRLPNGANVDLIANKSIASGQIAADLNLGNNVLVQAQTQVDQFAASLSSSVSDQTTGGTPVTSGSQTGFSLNLSGALPGNSFSVTTTNAATGQQQQVTVVNVADPSALPLPASMSSPGNTVIGINFATTPASSVATQLNSALGSLGLQFSMSGSTLQVLNSSSAVGVSAASVTTTTTATANGNSQLALFTDGTSPYTGAITSAGSQMTGYAGRITVNPAVVSNPGLFTTYNTSPATAAGDTTRSSYLYNQLTSASFTYSPQTGIGSAASPMTGTLSNYMQQFLSQQANSASSAQQLQQGQEVVLNTLQQSVSSGSGVNMDSQMSNLISLQNAYAANAHVMAVVQSMMSTLMQIQA